MTPRTFFPTLPLIALAALIFAVDVHLPLGVAAGVMYVAVVLLAAFHPNPVMPVYMVVGCTVLIITGAILSPPGGIFWMAIVNRALAIASIAVLSFLLIKRRQAEETRLESLRRLRAILQTAGDGVIAWREGGRVEMCNPAAERLFGCRLEEALGEEVTTFLPDWVEGSPPEHQGALRREMFGYRRDGTLFPAEVTISCTRLDSRLLYIAFVRDSTDRRIAEERLRQANQELDAFVRTVSHDLRSPLAPILGFADYLRDEFRDCLQEEGTLAVDEIESQGRRMLAMLDDLLQLAVAGNLERPSAVVEVGKVVREIVETLRPAAEAARVQIRCAPLPPAAIPESLLSQIFQNLIGNAIRYGARPEEPIEVGGERRGEKVLYFVRDHGPGVPPEERERIFDVFFRGSAGRKLPGTGIGLATVRKTALLYGGHAWVEETPGGGSTFCVELIDPLGEKRPSGKVENSNSPA